MRKTMVDELAQPVADPHTEVEMMYIADYLKSKGYSLEKLAELPAATAKALMEEASQFASLHLTEVEIGTAFVGAIHQDVPPKMVTAVSKAE